MSKIKFPANLAILILFIFTISGCGYNSLVEQDEKVNQAWAQVENQYQR
ncbi:MAG TPA: LemA family protein, partial [Ignavibacteria bacterium]|nr:LemA family protein [Ignavibacteria bacterium]